MLAKIKEFVKTHFDDIILLIGVILISLLSFAAGYIVAKQQEREPIRVDELRSSSPFANARVIEYEQQSPTTYSVIS